MPINIKFLQEVVLRRESAAVRLGLTLAYDGDHCATDIFVHQIDPDSVAARCGRIRVGDQLLQVF